jgi:uncharacterized protein
MPAWPHTLSRAMKLLPFDTVLNNSWQYFILGVILSLAVAACSPKDDSPAVLARQGWVSDYADKLKPEDKKRISTSLEAYEKETCHQIFLLIIPSLGGETIAEFSQRTASAWDIGQPGFGNGFLVSIALDEGTVRIETGSAFEWFIQDGTADKILKGVMFPFFRQDKFVEGLERGLEEIMIAGRLKPIPEDHKPDICRQ